MKEEKNWIRDNFISWKDCKFEAGDLGYILSGDRMIPGFICNITNFLCLMYGSLKFEDNYRFNGVNDHKLFKFSWIKTEKTSDIDYAMKWIAAEPAYCPE